MGSAVASDLAGRGGFHVTVVDENHPVRGSWGESRASHLSIEQPILLRMGLFSIRRFLAMEASDAQRADEATGAGRPGPLLHRAGRLWSGPIGSVGATVAAIRSELHGEPEADVERLSAADCNRRFPQVHLTSSEEALYMPHGYVLLVNNVLAALRRLAEERGAEWHEDERVIEIDRRRRVVTTSEGRALQYDRLVCTCGPWTNRLLQDAGLPLLPLFVSNEQTVSFGARADWDPSLYDWDRMPLFTWSEAGYKGRTSDGTCRYFYCVPHVGLSDGMPGFKIGHHRQGALMRNSEFVVADGTEALAKQLPHERQELVAEQAGGVDDFAMERTKAFVARALPGLDPERVEYHFRCLYQNTPDLKMVAGPHPADPNVFVLCGFSGSGFQFAPALANTVAVALGAVADEAESSLAAWVLAEFSPARFSLIG